MYCHLVLRVCRSKVRSQVGIGWPSRILQIWRWRRRRVWRTRVSQYSRKNRILQIGCFGAKRKIGVKGRGQHGIAVRKLFPCQRQLVGGHYHQVTVMWSIPIGIFGGVGLPPIGMLPCFSDPGLLRFNCSVITRDSMIYSSSLRIEDMHTKFIIVEEVFGLLTVSFSTIVGETALNTPLTGAC